MLAAPPGLPSESTRTWFASPEFESTAGVHAIFVLSSRDFVFVRRLRPRRAALRRGAFLKANKISVTLMLMNVIRHTF